MHGLALIYILRDLPEITSFKIIQESRQQVRVQIVPALPLTPAIEACIRDGFHARLGKASICELSQCTRLHRNGPASFVTWSAMRRCSR
jgi:hypothetical protein